MKILSLSSFVGIILLSISLKAHCQRLVRSVDLEGPLLRVSETKLINSRLRVIKDRDGADVYLMVKPVNSDQWYGIEMSYVKYINSKIPSIITQSQMDLNNQFYLRASNTIIGLSDELTNLTSYEAKEDVSSNTIATPSDGVSSITSYRARETVTSTTVIKPYNAVFGYIKMNGKIRWSIFPHNSLNGRIEIEDPREAEKFFRRAQEIYDNLSLSDILLFD